MRGILIVIISLLLAPAAFASEEGMLPFSEFRIQSKGIGESGIVIVEGLKNASGKYKKLSISAFGKVIEISDKLLTQIPSKYQNGIQLSYDPGWKQLGGRTVYISFLSGFTSGIKETFIIAVTEDGKQSVVNNP